MSDNSSPTDIFRLACAESALNALGVTFRVGEAELARIPATGPLVVANHPFGAVDPFGGAGAARRNLAPLRDSLRWLAEGGLLLVFRPEKSPITSLPIGPWPIRSGVPPWAALSGTAGSCRLLPGLPAEKS